MRRPFTLAITGLTALALLGTACSSDEPSADGTGLDLRDPTTADGPATTDSADATDTGGTPLEAALAGIVDETGVPAVGAALFDHNGPIEMAVSGVRQRGDDTKATVDDLFHLGSNTKAMTATLLARLEQQDRGVSFATTLADAFPDIEDLDPGYAEVTLAQLLTHNGGAPDDDQIDLDDTILSMPVTEGRAAGAEILLTEPPADEPGSTVTYSNAGYVIVGAAMERATGESWEDLMITEVFVPLAMDSCAFGPPGTDGEADQPSGHDSDGQPVHWDLPQLLGPAGTVHCSMGDWGRFLVEILNAARGTSDYLTSPMVEALLRPAPVLLDEVSGTGSAPGWLVIGGADGPDGPGYFHDGSNTAWYSQAVILPNTDRVVLAVTNEERTGQDAAARAFASLSDRDTGS